MNCRLEFMLAAWGRWAVSGATKALGYPPVSPMFRDAKPGRGYESAPPSGLGNGELLEIDAAVGELPPVLRIVVIHVYQQGGGHREIGLRIGVSHVSVGKYLAAAHVEIEKKLNAA